MTERCPRHDVTPLLRRNKADDTLALACPLCDVEERGGTPEDVERVRQKIADEEKQGQSALAT